MALKDIFTMVKADRYTADGREEVIKARNAETEDARRTYQNGEISEKTGLMKTPNGWVPPKETKFGKVKQNKEGQWGVQTKQGKGSDFLKHKSEKEASRALANYTAGYNTTERSKQDPHSDYARQQKQWNKETDRMRKASNAERRAEHASHFQESKSDGMPGQDYPTLKKEDHVKLAKEVKSNTLPGGSDWTAEEIAKEWQLGKADAEEVKKEFDKLKESKPTATEPEDKSEIRISSYMDKNFAGKPNSERNAFYDFVKKKIYKSGKDPQQYLGQGGYSYPNKLLNEYLKEWQAKDAAPRVLTGDTRIRVRKA